MDPSTNRTSFGRNEPVKRTRPLVNISTPKAHGLVGRRRILEREGEVVCPGEAFEPRAEVCLTLVGFWRVCSVKFSLTFPLSLMSLFLHILPRLSGEIIFLLDRPPVERSTGGPISRGDI